MTRLRNYRPDAPPPEIPPGSVVTVFRVPPEDAGQRLDVFMKGQLRRTSRTRTQHIIRLSAFDRTGRRLKPNDRVFAEQEIFLWRAPWDETPVPTDIEILYEDDFLLAVNKPAHLPVHPTARYHKNTLIKILQSTRPGEFLSLGHRLDRETSGVILISKTPECDRALKRQLELREGVEKTYLAFTWGIPDDGTGELTFRCERALELDVSSKYGVKMRLAEPPHGLYAATGFSIEEVRRTGERAYAKVRCQLETGRQHQIRLHLASLGAPIVGDKLYGPDDSCFARGADGELTPADLVLLELPRHALHAAELELDHPLLRTRLALSAPLPADLEAFWARLLS